MRNTLVLFNLTNVYISEHSHLWGVLKLSENDRDSQLVISVKWNTWTSLNKQSTAHLCSLKLAQVGVVCAPEMIIARAIITISVKTMQRPTLLSRCSAYLIQFTKGSLNYLNQARCSLLEYGYHGQLTAITGRLRFVLFLTSFSIDKPEFCSALPGWLTFSIYII